VFERLFDAHETPPSSVGVSVRLEAGCVEARRVFAPLRISSAVATAAERPPAQPPGRLVEEQRERFGDRLVFLRSDQPLRGSWYQRNSCRSRPRTPPAARCLRPVKLRPADPPLLAALPGFFAPAPSGTAGDAQNTAALTRELAAAKWRIPPQRGPPPVEQHVRSSSCASPENPRWGSPAPPG